jgi:hypothetical protein
MPTKSTKKKLQNNSGTSNKSLKKNYRNKNGGGSINDMYSSDDYKDAGTLDAFKFKMDDRLSARGDLPPFPGCTIL